MTDLVLDPFVQYGGVAANMLAGVYADLGNGAVLSVAPWDTTGTIAYQGPASVGAAGGARRVLPGGTYTKLITSMRAGFNILPTFTNGVYIFDWRDAGNNSIASLWCDTDGTLYLRNPAGTRVLSSTAPVMVAGNYEFLEFELDLTSNTFTLRANDAAGTGTPIMAGSGLSALGAGPISQFTLAGATSGQPATCWEKDLIIRSTAGTVNNGFNGDRSVGALFPISDTANAGWTPRFYHEFGVGILNVNTANAGYSAPSATSTDLGAGDWTIEGFFRVGAVPAASAYSTFMSKWDSANNKRSYRFMYGGSSFNANCLQFDYCLDGTNATVTTAFQYPWTPDLDRWYHIAVVRASGELLLFVDGNQLGLPVADAHTYYAGTEPLGVGVEVQGTTTVVANTSFKGWMDETRLTVGYARYNAPFTPSGPFPRGGGSDPQWADVALLCGYDSLIQDESSFGRALTPYNGAAQFTVGDGPALGSWTTLGVNKIVPDDNSFLTAPLTAATGILTMTTQPSNGDTVTVGTKDGSTAAVYTFKTALASAFDVLIDTTAQNTLLNLYNAINAGSGAGTKYGTGTTANFDVTASQLPAGQIQATANVLGTGGNSIASTSTGGHATWGGTTLSGGANIPGPSDFKVQHPPPHVTIIEAVQLNVRMFKSDAGSCSVQPALIGPLGGVENGANHALTVSPVYYGDVLETDPDTAGPITPTTLVNGALRLNRTA